MCTRLYGVSFEYSLSQINPCYGREDVTVYPHFHYPRVTITTPVTLCLTDESGVGGSLTQRRYLIFGRPRYYVFSLGVKRPLTHVSAFSWACSTRCSNRPELCAIYFFSRLRPMFRRVASRIRKYTAVLL